MYSRRTLISVQFQRDGKQAVTLWVRLKITFVHAFCKGKLNVPSQKSKQIRFAYINSAESITSKKYDPDFE